jgi:hypothetical protein
MHHAVVVDAAPNAGVAVGVAESRSGVAVGVAESRSG